MGVDAKQAWLGFDIGGTQCRAALVDADGAIVGSVERSPTPSDAAGFVRTVQGLRDACLCVGCAPLKRVGVGIPGWWDRRTGVMRRALNLPFLEGLNVPGLLTEALGGAVRVESDVNAAGWAQYAALRRSGVRFGEDGVDGSAFAYVSIGTGIGASVVVDSALVTRARGGPGHFGHLVVDTSHDAPLCRCGMRGCAEAVIAAWRAACPVSANPRTSSAASAVPASDSPAVVSALAILCLHLAGVYAPGQIVLGGGVVDADGALVDNVRRTCERLRGALWPTALALERAPLRSDEAGVIGAALLAGRC